MLSVYARLLPAIGKDFFSFFAIGGNTRRSTFSDLKTIVAGDVTLGDGAFIGLPIGDRTILDDWRRFVLALELLHGGFGFGYAVRLNFEMSNFLSVADDTIRIVSVRAEIRTFYGRFPLLIPSAVCVGILCLAFVGRHIFATCFMILLTTLVRNLTY